MSAPKVPWWSRLYAATMGVSFLVLVGMEEFILAGFALGYFLHALISGLHEVLEK